MKLLGTRFCWSYNIGKMGILEAGIETIGLTSHFIYIMHKARGHFFLCIWIMQFFMSAFANTSHTVHLRIDTEFGGICLYNGLYQYCSRSSQ